MHAVAGKLIPCMTLETGFTSGLVFQVPEVTAFRPEFGFELRLMPGFWLVVHLP